ncbi:MAG: TRAP transporter small permease subunit [Dysosmobacter sp.]|nr:TRAP transporter small permease subunit [Dysosmobacter sp.]
MKTLKNVICKINDFLGVVFPCILFLALFFSFVITIFARYIFHKSITWGNEVAILAYIWIMFFGCGKAMENDEHVVFSLVYDVVPPVVKMLMKIVYNAVLAVFMVICFQPCLKALMGSSQITGVLKIPYKVAFAPFFWMMLNIIVYSILNIRKAIVEYKNPEPAAADNKEVSA